jgi:hypothetical protein
MRSRPPDAPGKRPVVLTDLLAQPGEPGSYLCGHVRNHAFGLTNDPQPGSSCLTSHVVATSYSEGKLRMTTSETILPSRTEK